MYFGSILDISISMHTSDAVLMPIKTKRAIKDQATELFKSR
jgi:hypothetical protein